MKYKENSWSASHASASQELQRKSKHLPLETKASVQRRLHGAEYISRQELDELLRLVFHFERRLSKRTLARELVEKLRSSSAPLSFDTILGSLTGKGSVVRKTLFQEIFRRVEQHGFKTMEDVKTYLALHKTDVENSLSHRSFLTPNYFLKLIELWKNKTKQPSTRALALVTQKKLNSTKVLSVDHIQRMMASRGMRVRKDIMSVVEQIVIETLGKDEFERQIQDIEKQKLNADLDWVNCRELKPWVEAWRAEHPLLSIRQLALRVSSRILEWGYVTTPNTIQPILGGWKKRTRVFVKRALELEVETSV